MDYSSNRSFQVLAYTISHSMLILRSRMIYPDEDSYSVMNNYNIDIEFYSVKYIELPSILDGLNITLLKNNIPTEIAKFCDSQTSCFELVSNQRKYYVIAGGCLIAKNTWDENRISNIGLKYQDIVLTLTQ